MSVVQRYPTYDHGLYSVDYRTPFAAKYTFRRSDQSFRFVQNLKDWMNKGKIPTLSMTSRRVIPFSKQDDIFPAQPNHWVYVVQVNCPKEFGLLAPYQFSEVVNYLGMELNFSPRKRPYLDSKRKVVDIRNDVSKKSPYWLNDSINQRLRYMQH